MLFIDPASQINEPAPLGTKGKGRQFEDLTDLKSARAGRTASVDHDSLFGLEGAGLGDSVVVGVAELAEAEESVEDFVVPFDDDLSASAAFL